ncbi:hypothetical protein BU26DRAFT_570328 [Trematosphaeria pertusa]|uniref:PCI domain-containing protein n=1 Tax=Trematosphaeria pertusa TaxID=390896 RepID=A0A6A6I007_9PLEO|nr:uncharacterized protein BU26DRAFT_570328 [Trematosphaeria pertusa]KAF2242900.1 hypothetical protein BU26DRAFT_570328 [Trematosphaeria pertusa]
MSFPTSTVAWSQYPMQPPAYTSVPARTTLPRPAPPPPATPAPATPQKVEWSPAVRAYVSRAFDAENAIAGISQAEMTEKLRAIISSFAERDALDAVDWPNHPLPQEILRAERAAAKSLHPQVYQHSALMTSPNELANPPFDTPQSKKRKSQDKDELQARPAEASIPPWRRTNLEDRITYSNAHNDKRHKKNALFGDTASKLDQADLEKRKQRFQLPKSGNKSTPPWSSPRHDSDSDMSTAPVIGTNQSLEKSYFRLTAPPKAETVRPLHVLEKSLAMLTKKWKAEKNYNYICNQFKSLRQDLTVQHIKNAFTVKVYEIHARVALEKGDLGEYNQCQTQLKALYSQKLGGNPAEFTAYRILYFVYTCNKTDMNDLLAELTPADKTHPWIKHALNVRSALALGNYHKFFRLYLDAQNMGGYLMDMFIERERLHALANISRAYTNVAQRFLTDELGFENDDACREFLDSHGAQHIIDEKVDEQGARQFRVKVREGAAVFESLRAAAFSKVDIKGQI